MGISNSASGFRPGVCTSTTRPTAPFNGQVIYETDTKQTLVWQGSAWVMLTDADSPPGLQLIKTQSIGTGVSSVEITSAFSSEFDNYKIIVGNVNYSVADTTILCRPGNVSTSNYYGGGFFALFTGGGLSQYVLNAGNAGGVGITTQTNRGTVIFDISEPFNSSSWTRMHSLPSIGNNYVAFYTSMLATSASYTSFTIFPASGTMTGGTIRVYGYRNTI
jgi:hypothetical protein